MQHKISSEEKLWIASVVSLNSWKLIMLSKATFHSGCLQTYKSTCACWKGLIQPKIKTLQLFIYLFIPYPLQYFLPYFPFCPISIILTVSLYCFSVFSPIQVITAILKTKLEFVTFKYSNKKKSKKKFLWFFWVFNFLTCLLFFPNIFNFHIHTRKETPKILKEKPECFGCDT